MLRIMNRSWVSNPIAVIPDDPASLWPGIFRAPPAENSLIVYNNGTVLEGNNFPPWKQTETDVYVFIPGGTIYPIVENSWLATTLTTAGYVLE